MQFQDYYETLGVKRDASQEEIKKAYRRLSKQYHPDRNKDPGAEDTFKKIGEAYQVLGDADKRKQYDGLGAGWHQGQDFRPPPGWQGVHFDFDSAFGGARGPAGQPAGFSDFFEMLFGQSMPGGGGARQRGRGRSPYEAGNPFGPGGAPRGREGEDREAELVISLHDAYHGATRTVNLTHTQTRVDGGRAQEQKTYEVKIPPGTTSGTKIRLKGQGTPGLGGGKPGDLFLKVKIAPHPQFEVQGHNLHAVLPITPWEAALGAKVPFATLDGEVKVAVPPGTSSGKKLRLKGKGLPMKGGERGDIQIELKIVVPDAVEGRVKELFEELAKASSFNPRR